MCMQAAALRRSAASSHFEESLIMARTPAVSKSVSLQLQFMVLNVIDVQGLDNILSTIGGTHQAPLAF